MSCQKTLGPPFDLIDHSETSRSGGHSHSSSILPADHRARIVWQYVESLDLSSLNTQYKAVDGVQGRNPSYPPILLALWIYATTEAISSAREIDRRCTTTWRTLDSVVASQ